MSHQLTGTKQIQKCSVDEIAAAVLYEGYILYPYRASAVKNQHRFNFGTLSPQAWSDFQNGTDVWEMQTECLVHGDDPVLDIRVRFLHPMARQIGKLSQPVSQWDTDSIPDYDQVASLNVNNQILQTWQEVIEREVRIDSIAIAKQASPIELTFQFPASRQVEPLHDTDGQIIGLIAREQEAIAGSIEISADQIGPELRRVRIQIRNESPLTDCRGLDRQQVMLSSLASTHTILESTAGQFISLLEPPDEFNAVAKACENKGCWPVLVGDPGDRNVMLSSPIILYDYPQIAAESDGDFFDGCEIDEMLALRVMTLTDDEKQEMRGVDDRARAILERTDTRPEDYLMKLHGTMKRT